MTRPEALLGSPLRPLSSASGGLLERAVRGRLERLVHGSLTLRSGSSDGSVHEVRYGQAAGVDASGHADGIAEIHDERFWSAIALRGSVGAGEAYAFGWWTSPEPTDVVRVFVANHTALEGLERGLARLSLPLLKAYHLVRDNTRKGSARNIAAHYDLSNEFFGLFLDPTMTYSSAVFEHPDATLEEAQLAKIDRLCERLALGPDDHLLEIGTGWGGFAIRAASKFGCRVTTTTISKQQHTFASERVDAAGLGDRIDVRLADYRDLEGQYTKIVSVEMIEAVGARHYRSYFKTCERLLVPGGAFACQAITIHDRHFERARKAVDFIQRHIFPGSCIPSVTSLTDAAREASDFRLVHMEDIGEHYAPTLRLWRDRMRAHWSEAQALGFDDDFLRLFDFYFAYCEGGFIERHISVGHLVFAREGRHFSPPIAAQLLRDD
ncbi:class I SAM-dependent methyltransferase [Saltatorellus ferox]|uniref:class I SAM-dependent methyltransferase n=1 Tax=Saltatorellus ferox TaxID=2528018 RepID=UPI003AF3A0C2